MNPVLKNDLRGLLRLRRVAAIQAAFIVVMGILVLASWPQQGIVSLASHGQDPLLLSLILGQLGLMILFVPGIAAVSITAEREQGTLEMLYASRLSAWELIVGKLGCAIGYPLILLVTGLPFFALLCYRGDVDLTTLVWSYSVLVVSAIMLAILALTVSALCRQTSTALVVAYLVILILCGGVLVPAAIMLASQAGSSAQILHYVRSVSPVAAALSLLRPNLAELGGRLGGFDRATGQVIAGLLPAWKVFFPFAASIIVVCLAILIRVLGRPPINPDASRTTSAGAHAFKSTLLRRFLFLIDPKKPRKPIGRRNPIMAKESRTNRLRSGGWLIRICYGAFFVSLGLALMAMYGGQTEHGDLLGYVAAILVTFQLGVIVLIDPSLTSPAISSEIAGGTFEMLRLAPVRAGQIFRGKLFPFVLPAVLPIIALLPAYGAICFVNDLYVRPMVLILPVFLMNVALCFTMGLVCSAFAANTARATVSNYLCIAAIVIVPMLPWFASSTYFDVRWASWLAMPSPLVMALNLLPDGAPQIARLWPQHLMLTGGLCVVMLIIARLRLQRLIQEG